MPDDKTTVLQRTCAHSAAWLAALGMATGILVAFSMTGKVKADEGATLAAHLNAIIGALLIVAFAWTLPMLRWGDTGKWRLATLVITANYSNWFITIVKSFLFVKGVGFADDLPNDAIHMSLNVFVVVPSLAACVVWALGFRRSP